jgi:hypothetical protein
VPNPQDQVAFAAKSGAKKNVMTIYQELDGYFANCAFIKQWPESNTYNSSIREHVSPFDLYLVSMNPTVIVHV